VTSTPITRLVEASRGEEICEQGEVESWTAGRIDGRHHLLVEYVEIDVQPDLFQRPFVQPPVHASAVSAIPSRSSCCAVYCVIAVSATLFGVDGVSGSAASRSPSWITSSS
jgi:hypothetical protein